MDASERAELIRRYSEGADAGSAALDGATDAELDARSTPQEWTAREVVHHLADAELRSTVRLRQLLAEDETVIQGYDEAGYAKRLPPDRSIVVSLDAVAAARRANVDLLRFLGDADFARAGTHTESGATASRTGSGSTPPTRSTTPSRFGGLGPQQVSAPAAYVAARGRSG
jgi:hypothetical protein